MNLEQIATINEFLTRGEMRLARGNNIYLILHVEENGQAVGYRNPNTEQRYTTITLTEKEIASLANICFPAKGATNDGRC